MNGVTRREFFTKVCSRDSLKDILGAWYGFSSEMKKAGEISCDEAGMLLGKKLAGKNRLSRYGKEG